MKKVLFSFLFVFSIFIAVNSCQAYTITSPHGVEYNINDEYQTYLAYAKDSNNEYVLVSKQKGIFKLEWSSGWNDYALVFYPEGSTSSAKFDYYYWGTNLAYSHSSISSGIANNTCEISECNTNVVYGSKLNPDGNEVEGQVFFQLPAQVEKGILTQVLEKEIQNNPKLVLEQIAVILIPILVAVVFFLGFRKAWKILRTSLNNA